MQRRAIIIAVALIMAPLDARGADLVVWWEGGYYAQEDEAIAEIVAAFERNTGKQVELVLQQQEELPGKIIAALEASEPPDFAFGIEIVEFISKWALEGRLVDLSDAIGSFSNLFDPDALDRASLLNAKAGQKGLYALPIGRSTNHLHVWKDLLEQAGLELGDIPSDWEAFWSFWCDEVQPAVRRAVGRVDVWGVGLNMSAEPAETWIQFQQFMAAYNADYVTSDGRVVIDRPEIRRRIVRALNNYTEIYHKGCTPPDSAFWVTGAYNNQAFLDQTVVMTPNETLSIPNALRGERPDDYFKHAATIEWPLGPDGEPFPLGGTVFLGVVFEGGDNVETAKEFVRFLMSEGWLAHYLNFSGERLLPPMSELLEQPFWLDPSDPHRMAAVMQVASRPLAHNYVVASGDWRHDTIVSRERIWQKAVHRVVTEGISPEQAVDDAIVRIKEILSE